MSLKHKGENLNDKLLEAMENHPQIREEEKLRIQIAKQEETINELRDEIANLKGGSPDGNLETVELEVKLQNAEARAVGAEQQLEHQALMHAREISNLKQ